MARDGAAAGRETRGGVDGVLCCERRLLHSVPGRCDPRRPHDPHGLDRRVRHVPQYGGCAEKQARHHARRREDQRFGGHGGHGGAHARAARFDPARRGPRIRHVHGACGRGAQPPAGACARHRAGARVDGGRCHGNRSGRCERRLARGDRRGGGQGRPGGRLPRGGGA